MSYLIKEKSLSVGYNMEGQKFFDIIYNYETFIHSYFFSLTDDIGCNTLDVDKVIATFTGINTYNIPANLLLNTSKAEYIWNHLIMVAKRLVNLRAVTVLSPSVAKMIKNSYPELEVHLSVRYWDYHPDTSCNDLLDINMETLMNDISVVNISDVRSLNDFDLFHKIEDLGCKTKIIVNEGCIINRSNNYKDFEGYENSRCSGAPCHVMCSKVTRDYPWMVLSRALIYKETLQCLKDRYGIQYDILKISTRYMTSKEVDNLLHYWVLEERTKSINSTGVYIEINDRNYDVFNEWVEYTLRCRHNCSICQRCKNFYDKLIMKEE